MTRGFNSGFAKDLDNMIDFKVSLGSAESTYLSRAKSFDRYAAEKYPETSVLTEVIILGWIKPDINVSQSGVHYKLAFARAFGRYLRSVGRTAYVISETYTTGYRTFIPYIFSDEELKNLFHEIDLYDSEETPFEPILYSTYFRLTCLMLKWSTVIWISFQMKSICLLLQGIIG